MITIPQRNDGDYNNGAFVKTTCRYDDYKLGKRNFFLFGELVPGENVPKYSS
jgi:hypothetical protein